jgi:hypothetical protein
VSYEYVIVEVDGTLADRSRRRALVEGPAPDWVKYYEDVKSDPPLEGPMRVVQRLAREHQIIIASIRPARLLADTVGWLFYYEIPFVQIWMREANDYSPNALVKKRMWECSGLKVDQVLTAIDDSVPTAAMWRSLGIPCLLV